MAKAREFTIKMDEETRQALRDFTRAAEQFNDAILAAGLAIQELRKISAEVESRQGSEGK